jgi:hypothetical protein
MQENRLLPFVFPDPVTSVDELSGASLIYFQEPILLLSPPQVVTKESRRLLTMINEYKPDWGSTFMRLFVLWRNQIDRSLEILDLLTPLKKKAFLTVWLSYPANLAALEESKELIFSTGLSYPTLERMINPANAAGEIVRHVLLEGYLECNEDPGALYNYCDKFFRKEPISEMLIVGYFLRMRILGIMRGRPILLTNTRLTEFLKSLPIEEAIKKENEQIDNDIIAWEFFRHLVSPRLDPLNKKKVELIQELIEDRKDEIKRLRIKCLSLAEDVRNIKSLDDLPSQISKLIHIKVEKEIGELLRIDRVAVNSLVVDLLSDEKTWAAFSFLLAGILSHQIHITQGAALASLALFEAKAFKSAAERRAKLKQSDYALVYTITRKV